MSAVQVFRKATLALILITILAALFHVILLASDSEEYRRWVLLEIGLLVVGAVLFLLVLRFKIVALFLLVPLSIAFTIIHDTYINYAHTMMVYSVFFVAWLAYGLVVKCVWTHFKDRDAAPPNNAPH